MHWSASTWLHSSRGEEHRLGTSDQEEACDVGIGYQSGNPWLKAPSWAPQSLPPVLSAQMVATMGTQAPGLCGGLFFVTSHLAHGAVPLRRWQRAHAPGSTSAKKQLKCLYSPRGAGISGVTPAVSLSRPLFSGLPPKTFSRTFHTF